MQLPVLPPDKLGHYLVGTVLGIAAGTACTLLWTPVWAGEAGIATAAVIGGLKERFDRKANQKSHEQGSDDVHGVEWWDAGATALGGVAVSLPYLILKVLAKVGV